MSNESLFRSISHIPDFSGAEARLSFIFDQLTTGDIERIVDSIERYFTPTKAPFEPLTAGDIKSIEKEALARLFYAMAGQSREDILIALTVAELEAMQVGAEDLGLEDTAQVTTH